MPLNRISLRQGKSPEYTNAVVDGIYRALRETFDVPDKDLFAIVEHHSADTLVYSPDYLGIRRSDDFVAIEITVSDTRRGPKKEALYRAIAANLEQNPGIRPEDVFIVLVEVKPENWSFGNGKAQYLTL